MRSLFLTLFISSLAMAQPELRGEFTQGGVVVGQAAKGSQVWLNEAPIKVSTTGKFVFGFSRDERGAVTVKVAEPNKPRWSQTHSIAKREYNIQRIEGVPDKMVNPPAQRLERIRQENAQVAQARKLNDDREDFFMSFQWPVVGPISGVYGSQRVFNGVPKRPHYGVDVAIGLGTDVVAPAGGVVTLAHNGMYYSGGTLIIDHGHQLSSTFLHLNSITVKSGDVVKQGQLIAKSGVSGRATGPHLDWRMNWKNKRVDPQLLVPAMESLLSSQLEH